MKTLLKGLSAAVLVALLVAGSAGAAAAAPIVSLNPAAQTVGIATPFSVDVVVSGLDGSPAQAIGGFAFTLAFNSALFTGASYVADPDARMGAEIDLSFGFTGAGLSPFDAFVVADLGLNGAALAGLQGTGFRLMRINFVTGVTEGLSPLTLSQVVLSDADGQELASTFANGAVCVDRDGQDACPSVPEPGMLALVGAGLATMAARRRRAKA